MANRLKDLEESVCGLHLWLRILSKSLPYHLIYLAFQFAADPKNKSKSFSPTQPALPALLAALPVRLAVHEFASPRLESHTVTLHVKAKLGKNPKAKSRVWLIHW